MKKREIRVFISSTFRDMQPEREHLTQVIFPKLRKACGSRGVSFYAIDLRWGITEKEAHDHRTLEICLEQVKQCIPYFIGLIGNRYGWIPEAEHLPAQYPWLSEYPDISATEMEIRYYLREALEESKKQALFAVKGEPLLNPDDDDGQPERIQALTEAIRQQTGTVPFVYESIEDLGESVYRNILSILDREFPPEECTREHLLEQYIHRMEHYDDSRAMEEMEQTAPGGRMQFARRDPFAFDVMERAMLSINKIICLEEPGMELLCNRYLYLTMERNLSWCRPELTTVCLMLDADPGLRTPLGIMEELCSKLKKYAPEGARYPWPDAKTEGINRLRQLTSVAVYLLQDIGKEKELLICITGLHLLDQNSPWYSLSFLAPLIRLKPRLFLTTADRSQAFLLEQLGLPCRNFPIRLASSERSGFFASLLRDLELEGKHLEKALSDKLLHSPVLESIDSAAFVSNYLKNYILFEDLSQQVEELLSLCEQQDVYTAVWQLCVKTVENDPLLVELAGKVFQVVRCIRLQDQDLDRVFTQTGTSRLQYLKALKLLRPFLRYDGSGLCIENPFCEEALEKIWGTAASSAAKGLVNIVLERLSCSWSHLDEQYALLNYLYDHGDTQQLVRLVTDNRWLDFARRMDPQIIRMGWRALEAQNALDIKKIYTDSNHLKTLSASREIYDLLMRMELAVAGTDLFECFLDIPFVYSTDSEKELKQTWTPTDRKAFNTLKKETKAYTPADLRIFFNNYVHEYGLNPFVDVYLWEILCKSFAQRNALERDDVEAYLWFAARISAPRQLAEALSYLSYCAGPFRMLR